MKFLLFSNSTNPGESFLEYPKSYIKDFLGMTPLRALFIPYAAVTISYDEYEKRVKDRFNEIGHDIESIHHFGNPLDAVNNAQVIVIGGGNTFHLLRNLQNHNLIEIIRERVLGGIPYIGWSAGSNITCPSICTTNDMPIIETIGLKGLNIIPFQINPHYTDIVPPNFGGETRDQRINEFLQVNQTITVVGLREGTFLKYTDNRLSYVGGSTMKVFRFNEVPYELTQNDSIAFFMK